jgi:hypothetical protein
MTESTLGRRYERLILLTAPITIATFIVLFVAVGAHWQKDWVQARCYEAAADVIAAKLPVLEESWKKQKPIKNETYWGIDYKLEISKALIFGLHAGNDCYRMMDEELVQRYRAPPAEIVETLRKDSKTLLKTPLQIYGIELPDRAQIDVLGTSIKIGLVTFAQALQLVLAPLLILWLGSLYNTRYRESLLIASATSLAQIFPHSINIYPAGRLPPVRKHSWLLSRQPLFVALMYCSVRIALVILLIGPPIILYLLSLYYLHPEQYVVTSYIVGSVVVLFGAGPLMVEAMPWHFWKIFPPALQSN